MLQLIVVKLLLLLSSLLFNPVNCSNQTDNHPNSNNTIITSNCNCGELDIINLNYWPWLVKIRSKFSASNKTIDCTGVLVSPLNVLTAGHCVYSSRYGSSGQVIVYLPPTSQQLKWIQLPIAKFTYDSRSNGTSHDIALITLITSVPVDYQPICLAINENITSAIVIGFNESKNQSQSFVQQSNPIQFKSWNDCEDERSSWLTKLPQLPVNQRHQFNGYNMIDQSMLCGNDLINDQFDINQTNQLNLIANNCKHNPGEPLIAKSLFNGKWYMVGIVSGTWFNHNYNNCQSLLPTIYTWISYYAEWINYNCVDCCLINPYPS